MFRELLKYAERSGVIAEAGFKPKRVRWLLQFSPSGDYQGMMPTSEDRKGREFDRVPHLQFSGDTPMRHFLVDTARYAVLYGESDPSEKLLAKHEFFLQRLRDAAVVEPVLGRIADALKNPDIRQRIHAELDQQSPKARPEDNLTFVEMATEGARIVVEGSAWQNWWREYWPGLFARRTTRQPAARMRCFLSGELVEPARTHPKIKGLGDVGGNIETTLVGFNLDAFCSYNLKQSANAAVSTDSAESYAAALNQLIAKQSRRLAGSKVVYWYSHDIPPEDDPVALILDGIDFGDAELVDDSAGETAATDTRSASQATWRAGELVDAIRTGQRPELHHCQYRALTLSGNAGRAVVRDWMEGQFEDLATNVDRWFSDLAIVHSRGEGLARPPKIMAVIGALVRTLDDAPPPLVTSLWRAAVNNTPIPYDAMARALSRVRIEVIKDHPPNHARMGLLKAYLIRKEICAMTTEHSASIQQPAYVCGKIMAVLAAIQHQALPGIGAGVVQRYYAAASATPALVLGRLVRLAQTGHLPKIEPPALRRWFDSQLTEAWSGIQSGLPIALTLEEQTLFAMGYYHQKARRTKTAGEGDASSTRDEK